MIRDALNIAKIHLDRLQKAKREIEIKIAHEYPDEQEEIVNDIKEAIKKVDYLAKVYKNIEDF